MKEKKELIIQTQYAPNRLSLLFLTDAYKVLLPLIKREALTLNQEKTIRHKSINKTKKEQKK